jgi:hypothetical protein
MGNPFSQPVICLHLYARQDLAQKPFRIHQYKSNDLSMPYEESVIIEKKIADWRGHIEWQGYIDTVKIDYWTWEEIKALIENPSQFLPNSTKAD